MKAMILAAGLGTRLLPLTREMAKAVVPFANRPLIHYHLEWLMENGVNEVVINLHHRSQSIISAIQQRSWPLEIHFSHEANLLGTAGGVKKAEEYFQDETFVMVNSDSLFEIDLASPIAFHREKGGVATMVLKEKSLEDPYGTVTIDEASRIMDIGESEAARGEGKGHTFIGIHVLEPEIFGLIPSGCFFEINQMVYPRLIEEGKPVWGFVTDSYWAEIGSHRAYLQAHRDFLNRHSFGVVSESELSLRARFSAPVLIGKGCEIEDEAQIGPMAVLGQDCHVGPGSIVEDSVIWDKVTVGRGAHVVGSIIGHETTIDSGSYLEGMVVSGEEGKEIH